MWEFALGESAQQMPVFQRQSSTAMLAGSPCHRGATTAPGAELQAEVHVVQHHDQTHALHHQHPHPSTVAAALCVMLIVGGLS